jgi:surface polysaccharide O-acyltransferase-like enzyme
MSKRNEYVELGRLIAATSIVWLHTVGAVGYLPLEGSTRWARWAVPFFIAASLWFVNPASESRTPWVYFKTRFLRLYPVFIFWNLFYLFVRVISGVFLHSSLKLDWVSFVRQLFFDGFAHHLWFLTFLLLVEIAITILSFIRVSSALSVASATIFLLIISLIPSSAVPTFGSYLLVMSLWSLPTIFLFVIFKPFIVSATKINKHLTYYSITLLIMGILTTWISSLGGRNSILEALSGVLLFFAFLLAGQSAKMEIPIRIRTLAATSAGIYLVHVFYVEVLEHLSSHIKLPVRSYEGGILIFVFSLIASIISVVLLKQIVPNWIFNGFASGRNKISNK